MALFRKTKLPTQEQSITAEPSVEFDEFLGNPLAHDLHDAFATGQWRAAHDYCEPLTEWEERYLLAGILAKVDPFPEEWSRSVPDAQFPLLVRGMKSIADAWKVRGSGKAETVQKQSWNTFFELLNQAETDLVRASEVLPEDPSPWTQLLISGRGLEVPKDEILRRFEEVNLRRPGFQPAHVAVVGSVAKKWSGSHDLMFDVARRADATLPDGSAGRIAICVAHFERRLYGVNWEQNKELGASYYKDPAVYEEIEGAAKRSVFSPVFQRTAISPILWSHFALALAMTGDAVQTDRISASRLFDLIGDEGIPDKPWTDRWGSKGSMQYARIRTLCNKA